MTEGKVYILARTGNSAYEEVGSAREDITIAESNNNGNDPNTEIIITIPEPTFDAKSWWPNSLVQGAAAGDVDFKIRSEDYAGNTTDSEDVSKKIIHVDEIDPSVLTIVTLETTVNNNNGNSIAQQGYWNIDTDKLRVTLSDMSEPNTDDNVVGGKVQLQGKVSDKDWTNLGLVKTITDANRTGFYIDVEDTEAGVGIEELQGADSWDDMNGEFIQIRAVVFDEAGNSSTWENQTDFQNLTNSPYIRIDGTKEAHRPLITNVTSDKTTGWWGHDSDDNTISIQITAKDKDDLGNLNPEQPSHSV